MARILRANLNQPRRDSGIPHESASGAFGISRRSNSLGVSKGTFARSRPVPAALPKFRSAYRAAGQRIAIISNPRLMLGKHLPSFGDRVLIKSQHALQIVLSSGIALGQSQTSAMVQYPPRI
jgi:hypothetical protein